MALTWLPQRRFCSLVFKLFKERNINHGSRFTETIQWKRNVHFTYFPDAAPPNAGTVP